MLLLNLYNDLCIQTLWKNTKKTELFFIKINLYILIFYIEIIQEKKEEEIQ